MADYDDSPVYGAHDSTRHNAIGLKTTSLAVLNKKKLHKTHTQKKLEEFNMQHRMSVHPLRNAPLNSMSTKQSINSQDYNTGTFQPPTFHKSSASSVRSPSFNSMTYQQPPQMFQHHQQLRSHSQESLAPPPLMQAMPQGHWSDAYRDSSDNSLGVYSPSSSEFGFEETKYASSQTSQSEWRRSNGGEQQEEILALKKQLERLAHIEQENEALKERNSQLMLENDKLLKSQVEEADETLFLELEETKADLIKTTKLCEELELKFTDATQQLNKFRLVHKTTLDQKNREIGKLKDDISSMALDPEKDYTLSSEDSINTADTSPLPTPKTTRRSLNTPALDINADTTKPQEVSGQTDLVQDLLYTIKTLKSHNEVLLREKDQLTCMAEKERRVLRALSHTSRNKTKIRKGLTILSEIDTLI
ncbi:CYFA0S03e04291g1_1 [Cyberlindnera fabianii]|uniref:CYFA0S03e04291g1_1 n=1 Tax=Cyberlindnera fabianii TaxID=36022 RepID=A0A061AXT6_CYBFA|nr:CYFA0S03e04291g1_1 [Cyberlindnera fabianii]